MGVFKETIDEFTTHGSLKHYPLLTSTDRKGLLNVANPKYKHLSELMMDLTEKKGYTAEDEISTHLDHKPPASTEVNWYKGTTPLDEGWLEAEGITKLEHLVQKRIEYGLEIMALQKLDNADSAKLGKDMEIQIVTVCITIAFSFAVLVLWLWFCCGTNNCLK